MTLIQQRLLWWFNSLGWKGLAGIAILVISTLVYSAMIIPSQEELAQLEQTLTDERQSFLEKNANSNTREQSEKRNINVLYRDFPGHLDAPKVLRKLYAAAENSNLILQRGTYKSARDSSGAFLRYEIEFPVQGTYPEIQLFTYQALKDIPTLALDDINFKRENSAETLLQAKLHFSLYMAENL